MMSAYLNVAAILSALVMAMVLTGLVMAGHRHLRDAWLLVGVYSNAPTKFMCSTCILVSHCFLHAAKQRDTPPGEYYYC